MNYTAVKKRIQHFLLQQDDGYRRSVQLNLQAPSMARVAKSLDKKCPIGQRRLQKYLSEVDNEKELSINLSDLAAFSQLVDMQPGQFLSYLLEEESLSPQLTPWKSNLIRFFSNIHHSLRRELNCTVFSGEQLERREKLLDLLLLLDKVNASDLAVVHRLVEAVVRDTSSSCESREHNFGQVLHGECRQSHGEKERTAAFDYGHDDEVVWDRASNGSEEDHDDGDRSHEGVKTHGGVEKLQTGGNGHAM